MAPLGRQPMELSEIDTKKYKPSAVMILLCRDNEDNLFIPLIERVKYDGIHSGQIALPGGKFEAGDLNFSYTARRECFEEIGIDDLDIIGPLTRLHIPVSGFLVHPFVGFCNPINPTMNYQEREVNKILRLNLADLLNKETKKHGSIQVSESLKIKAPYYEVGGEKVWGATAMILSELKEILRGCSNFIK